MPDLSNYLPDFRSVHFALHGVEDGIVNMLNGQIDVGTYFIVFSDRAEQIGGNTGRMRIKQPDPFDPLNLRQIVQQIGKPGPPFQIPAVTGRVLRRNDDFPDASLGQSFGFAENIIRRTAARRAAQEGMTQ